MITFIIITRAVHMEMFTKQLITFSQCFQIKKNDAAKNKFADIFAEFQQILQFP